MGTSVGRIVTFDERMVEAAKPGGLSPIGLTGEMQLRVCRGYCAAVQTVEQPRARTDAEGVFATSYRPDWLLVALLVAVGLVLRWPGFRSSLLGDELSTFFLTGQSIGGLLHLLNGHSVDLTPPLYFVLTHEIRAVAGLSVESLRAVSLAAGR